MDWRRRTAHKALPQSKQLGDPKAGCSRREEQNEDVTLTSDDVVSSKRHSSLKIASSLFDLKMSTKLFQPAPHFQRVQGASEPLCFPACSSGHKAAVDLVS